MSEVGARGLSVVPKLTRTLTITSGKGGVGKTTLVSNIALQMGRLGKRVLIFDGDMSMANVDIMFQKRSHQNIFHVLSGEAALEDIIMELEKNVFLIPGGSGIRELQRLSEDQKRNLLNQVSHLPMQFDIMLIDTAPGIDDNVLYLNSAAHEVNVVVTPDPASVADSYALIKVLNKYHKLTKFSLICNMVRDEAEGLALYKKISDIASRFLFVSLDYKGSVPQDSYLRHATKSQQLVIKSCPQSPSAQSLRRVVENLNDISELQPLHGGMRFFWEHLVGVA